MRKSASRNQTDDLARFEVDEHDIAIDFRHCIYCASVAVLLRVNGSIPDEELRIDGVLPIDEGLNAIDLFGGELLGHLGIQNRELQINVDLKAGEFTIYQTKGAYRGLRIKVTNIPVGRSYAGVLLPWHVAKPASVANVIGRLVG
jgi:hypothetical protein